MKTTYDLPEQLVHELNAAARERGTTARSLVEEAIRRVLADPPSRTAYRLPDLSVDGDGLQVEFAAAGWAAIRDAAYGDRA